MRFLIPVLLAVVLAAPASAQTPLQATFTPGYAISNDIPGPYVTTARINGSSNEVSLTSAGSLYFRVLRPELLLRTIRISFADALYLPWLSDPEGRRCKPFGNTPPEDFYYCSPPAFLPGEVPVTYSMMSTAQEWEYVSGWRPVFKPDNKGILRAVSLNFNTEGTWTKYAVLNWNFKLDEGYSTEQFTHWLLFSNTWDQALNEPSGRVGIVAVTRVSDTKWVVRPIDPMADGALPGGMVQNQALLTRYVLSDCTSGTGGSCYLGDYSMPFELTLTKAPKTRK